ncbi:MAG: hypothetical protein M1326_03370, partial [Cyanobacteria bacterium]|nr:hypothetical protein [Cyanobacteriota bacterium]
MQHLEQLLIIANRIRKDTESNCNINNIERYITGFNSWTRDAPVPTRPIWETAMFDASAIAHASYFLVVHGFYEEACSLIREIIDGFLTRLYFDERDRIGELEKWQQKDGRSTNEYWEWESGDEDNYPNYKKDIKKLMEGKGLIKKYDKKYSLWNDIEELFRKLGKFVHGRPETRHYDFASRSSSNITEFKKKHFDEWYEYLKSAYCIISILSLLQYKELFDSNYIKEFKELEPGFFK